MKERSFASNIRVNSVTIKNGIENYIDQSKQDRKCEKKALKMIAKVDEKFQEKTYTNLEKQKDIILHTRENVYGNRKVIQMQFRTIGCRMKKAGSCWNCNYGVADKCIITPNQYIKAFREAIKQYSGDVLVLESLGSITDPNEFDRDIFKKVFQIAIEQGNFNFILIETHLTQIDEELTKYISDINGGKKHVGYEIGIEDMNPENRKLINKIGVGNNKLKETYTMLQKYGIELDINLIYGFPFMNEQERIQALVNSVKNISNDLSKAEIVIYLMSVKENTIMEDMLKKGIYKPANPWGLVYAMGKIQAYDDIKNIITLSWFGEKEDPYIKEKTCYTCPECKGMLVDFFKNINGTLNDLERKWLLVDLLVKAEHLECKCYEKFKEQLKENDGKNPYIRYKEFLEDVSEKCYGED